MPAIPEIKISVPAVLPLGFLRIERNDHSQLCLLGISLESPAIRLSARRADQLTVRGPRAHIVHDYSGRIFAQYLLPSSAEIEVEEIIPAYLGLGGDLLLGLATAQALAWVHSLPDREIGSLAASLNLRPEEGLFTAGYTRGGLLLVDVQGNPAAPVIVRRSEIRAGAGDEWTFVIYCPPAPASTPEAIEELRLRHAVLAGSHLSIEKGESILAGLQAAIDQHDLAAMGGGLLALQNSNREARLQAAVTTGHLSFEQRDVLALFQDSGAKAWGSIPTGIGIYALIGGVEAGRELTRKVNQLIETIGGQVIATQADNQGARRVVTEAI